MHPRNRSRGALLANRHRSAWSRIVGLLQASQLIFQLLDLLIQSAQTFGSRSYGLRLSPLPSHFPQPVGQRKSPGGEFFLVYGPCRSGGRNRSRRWRWCGWGGHPRFAGGVRGPCRARAFRSGVLSLPAKSSSMQGHGEHQQRQNQDDSSREGTILHEAGFQAKFHGRQGTPRESLARGALDVNPWTGAGPWEMGDEN